MPSRSTRRFPSVWPKGLGLVTSGYARSGIAFQRRSDLAGSSVILPAELGSPRVQTGYSGAPWLAVLAKREVR